MTTIPATHTWKTQFFWHQNPTAEPSFKSALVYATLSGWTSAVPLVPSQVFALVLLWAAQRLTRHPIKSLPMCQQARAHHAQDTLQVWLPIYSIKERRRGKNFAKEFVGHSLLLLFPPPPLPSYLKHSQTLENISLVSFSQLAPSWQLSTRLTQPLSLSTVIKHSFPIGTHPHAALLYLQQECSHQGRPWGLPD